MRKSKKGDTSVLKAVVGIILGVICITIIAFFTKSLLTLFPGEEDSGSYEELMTKITELKATQGIDHVYFINEKHFLVGFDRGAQSITVKKIFTDTIIDKPTEEFICGINACICICSKAYEGPNVCRNPESSCTVLKGITTINGIQLSEEEIKDATPGALYIEGRNKVLLNIKKTENTLTITVPE